MNSGQERSLFLYIYKYLIFIIQFCGIFFNFIAIYFLKNDNKRTKKSYKTILLIHCFMDICLGIFHILGIYQIEIIGTVVFITVDGPLQYINIFIVHVLSFVITTFFSCSSVFCGCITIIYRYLIVVKSKIIKTTDIIKMFIPMLLLSGIISIQYIITFCSPNTKEYYIYKNLLDVNYWSSGKIYDDNFITLIIPSFKEITALFKLLEISCYFIAAIIVILFKILISKYLKNKKNSMSISTLKKEKQIQRTLIVQALLPIILFYIPNILLTFMIIFHIPFQYYTIFITISITYVPLVNPCIILLMTSQYRTKIFQVLWINKKKIRPNTISFFFK
ncbi:7TM GPCR, serpentine receptor class r (Str) family-containing protein [Strongyloides ratti]|uniref:7TM GPCR, serpentine receptor class r (Str) family-containing protein n=1 Tax=Strongyloides ratti TaxID=34506 RepID=A0A090LL53_STRRB|nr:7TM GPCR, serpentine receptor class r (Str) family-containing protein [Strongyloides ratti]CEF70445.1 7TM GPCR, serpentine receptor class r (Str) family-containing protein [Strongyloides ratti]